MKLFKNMMSRKPEPEETVGKIDLHMDVEPLRRKSEPLADDTGLPNGSIDPGKLDSFFTQPGKVAAPKGEEPEEAEGAGWGSVDWEDTDWDDDEEWGEDELDDLDGGPAQAPVASASGGHDWSSDEDFGRKSRARSQLTGVEGAAEDRILEKTNSKMIDRETSRRRSAMAHLKAAAAATKADRVLKNVASRDPAGDPEEQSPYRDDLAKVVRPRTTSRPISRPATRQRSITPPWDTGTGDDDAARFAAAAEQSLDGDRTPLNGAGSDHADPSQDFAQDPRERFASNEDRFATEDSAFAAEYEDEDEALYDDDRAQHIPDELTEDDFADGPAYGVNDAAAFDRFEEPDVEDDMAEDEDDAADAPLSNAFAVDAGATGDEDDFAADDEDEDDMDFDDGPVASSAVSEAVAMANEADDPSEEIDADEVRRQIWDVAGDAPVVRDPADRPSEGIVNVATAVTGRAGRSAGRVKTRLLGFQGPESEAPDVFETAKTATSKTETKFPVGWIIVIEGPGRGTCFTMFNGVSQIGRGEDQAVRLDFGDTSISRNNHAAVAYDDEQAKFFLGHGGKSNLVRLNGRPVLSTEELSNGDTIRIGETTLKFVSLCDETFSWKNTDGEDADNGENA